MAVGFLAIDGDFDIAEPYVAVYMASRGTPPTVVQDTTDRARLVECLRRNTALWECLHRLRALALPDWYLGAGCVAQSIWNDAHHKSPTADVVDFDVVYYDADLSEEREQEVTADVRRSLRDLEIALDVKNQARVHLWYPSRFGDRIAPYRSTEDAIGTWPTTATAIGVRLVGDEIQVCAPFGLDDLLRLVVRPNRMQVSPEIYDRKARRWSERWPLLTVLPWSQGVGEPGARVLRVSTRGEGFN